jgi:choline dehydrogenase
MNTETEKTYDYVVVGAGTAGCLLANRLSKDKDTTVALVEAGGNDNYHWIHIPVGYLYCINNPRTDWMYRTQADPGLNGRSLIYPRGRVLGGCSSINGMIYMRGQAADYDAWAEGDGHGTNPGWRWDEVLPLFKAHEAYHGGADEMHNDRGEWVVSRQRLSWEILDAFREAATQAGLPRKDDFNRGDNEGVGYFEVNQKKGFRFSAARAFLKPILARDNLSLFIHAPVQRLVFEGRRCVGLTVLREDGVTVNFRANKEVILCAGAVNTPVLLERSGVGQGARVSALGVPLVHDLPGVGENLQDHLQVRLAFKVQGVKTLNTLAANWLGKARIGLEYLLARTGPMSMAPSQLGAFARSSERHARANVQYHVQPLTLEAFGQPLHPFNAFTASVCNLRPTSRGSIHAASSDPNAAPVIAPNYLSSEEDRQVAAESIRLTRRIVSQPALARYRPEEFKPGMQFVSDEDLATAAGAVGTTIFHPVGTCKMGPAADPQAVCDAQGRVHGVGGLRVVDASLMPTITSGNTNSPTLMIAEKIARDIRGR